MTNFRLLIVDPDNLIVGDKVLTMGHILTSRKFDQQPCKLQMEIVDEFKNKLWVDVPFATEKR